jgi:DNA ligase-1
VLLIDVAATSLDVAGASARRAKVARIAELLNRAAAHWVTQLQS